MNGPPNRQKIQNIATYALEKPHTQTEDARSLEALGNHVQVILRCSDEDFLVSFDHDRSKRQVARFAVPEADLSHWVESDPAISKSDYVPRRGMAFIDVSLDAESDEICRALIDQSYDRMISKLSPQQKFVLELTQSQLPENAILERLIASYDLSDQATLIRSRIQQAALLVPLSSTPQSEKLGASFVGGVPHLDASEKWPVAPDGKSLGFLGQFNLEEFGDNLPDSFPHKGLLSIFSVWAEHEAYDEPYGGDPEAPAKILITPLERLGRRSVPSDVKPYPQVAVRAVKVPDLGAVDRDPPFNNLDWDHPLRKLIEHFDAILMCRYYGNFDSMHGHHRLGGAGRYQQEFPESLRETDRTVIACFGTDELTQMEWGDGADLTLLAYMDEVRSGGTTDVWTENQGG